MPRRLAQAVLADTFDNNCNKHLGQKRQAALSNLHLSHRHSSISRRKGWQKVTVLPSPDAHQKGVRKSRADVATAQSHLEQVFSSFQLVIILNTFVRCFVRLHKHPFARHVLGRCKLHHRVLSRSHQQLDQLSSI